MRQISCRLTLPSPAYVTLLQYYDSDHIGTVHPETLGEVKLITVRDEGRDVLYEHHWPGRRRRVNRVRPRYVAPPKICTPPKPLPIAAVPAALVPI